MSQPDFPPLSIVEAGHRWVVVNKPAGIGVEKHFQYDTVEMRALQQFRRLGATKPPYIGIVHRLDRVSSGCLLLARNKSTLVNLQQQFERREIQKIYWTLVRSAPPKESGQLKHYLLKDRTGKKAIATSRALNNAKLAELSYRLIKAENNYYLLEIDLHSGRFHQIRAQLAAIGCPIVGDRLYSGDIENDFVHEHRIALHARRLSFKGIKAEGAQAQQLTIEAPLPDYWPIAGG
ncbi:MAG: RNA pseudouridine synthase [Bacteroidota bacterium]